MAVREEKWVVLPAPSADCGVGASSLVQYEK